MKTLVTGGAGFIGSNLVALLLRHGHEVSVIDDLSSGKIGNLGESAADIKFVEGDVRTHPDLDALVGASDTVFHLAAMVGVRTTLEKPMETFEVNALGSKRVFAACLNHDVPVLFSSTSDVYGENTEVPLTERSRLIFDGNPNGRWIYSYSKLVAEAYCLDYATRGLKYAILRYFNCYGPNMTTGGYSSVVAKFIQEAMAGRPITVYGDGCQTRSFTFVKDLVQATYHASEHMGNTTLNVGATDEIPIFKLAHKIKDLTGSRSPIVFVNPADVLGNNFAESPRRRPDNSKAETIIDFAPTTGLHDGLLTTYHWMKRAVGRKARAPKKAA